MKKINGDTDGKDLEEITEIRKYFSRIYTVLSKDIRKKLDNLDISKKEKKKLKKELAFLPKQTQFKYLRELYKQFGLKFDTK
ncbi:MAG: hypothetical protein ACFE91_01255 [Promethearchaeota archaeon]